MRVLIAYYSETGNTEKVAQHIYNNLELEHKSLKKVQDIEEISGYDMIFCGFPVIEHSVPMKMQSLLKKIPDGSKVALFATHGCLRGGHKAKTAFETAMTILSGSKVIGTFGCRGQVRSEVLEALHAKFEHKAWAEEASSAAGHPDESDLNDAADFANEMVHKGRI